MHCHLKFGQIFYRNKILDHKRASYLQITECILSWNTAKWNVIDNGYI